MFYSVKTFHPTFEFAIRIVEHFIVFNYMTKFLVLILDYWVSILQSKTLQLIMSNFNLSFYKVLLDGAMLSCSKM